MISKRYKYIWIKVVEMGKKRNTSSVIYGKKTIDFVYFILLSCIMIWILLLIKLLQTALNFPLFEKFLPPQCDRACGGPAVGLWKPAERWFKIM